MSRPIPWRRVAFALFTVLAGCCLFPAVAAAVAPFTLELVDSDPAGSMGESSSMKVDHLGHPHVAYYDAVHGNLKYAFHNGTNWVVTTADNSADDVGEFCAIALDSLDRPHIAYYDGAHQRLMYTAKLGATWTREVVNASFDCGWHPSIATDRAGRVWISSYDRGVGNPRIDVRAPAGGWTGEYIDTTFTLSGFYTSIATDRGSVPHVAYYDLDGHKLIYATRRLNAQQTKLVWVQQTADSGAHDVGLFPSLVVDRFGRVQISYMDLTTADLMWAIRDPNSGQWSHLTVDGGLDEVGYYCSMALDPVGYPAIAYHDGTLGILRLARRDAAGWHLQTVDDSPGVIGLYSSIGSDSQGNLRMSYWDGTARTLKFAWGPSTVLTGVPPLAVAGGPHLVLAPNPARAGSRVRFLAHGLDAERVEILDIAGRRMLELPLDQDREADWNPAGGGASMPAGVYLARALRADGTHAAIARLVIVH